MNDANLRTPGALALGVCQDVVYLLFDRIFPRFFLNIATFHFFISIYLLKPDEYEPYRQDSKLAHTKDNQTKLNENKVNVFPLRPRKEKNSP